MQMESEIIGVKMGSKNGTIGAKFWITESYEVIWLGVYSLVNAFGQRLRHWRLERLWNHFVWHP